MYSDYNEKNTACVTSAASNDAVSLSRDSRHEAEQKQKVEITDLRVDAFI